MQRSSDQILVTALFLQPLLIDVSNREVFMNLYDVIGPVMVGPSSSHTAGAVKIGYVTRRLLNEKVRKAQILLYGSFYMTGEGHGTRAELLEKLREYLREPRSRAELQQFCHMSSRDYFRKNILKPLIVSKKISPTKPDKPTSSKQKYVWNDN
jgi:hypothetical protein